MHHNGDILRSFDHQPRTRLVFGAGCVDDVGDHARRLGAQRVLVVSDPGIVQAGHVQRVCESLAKHRIHFIVFDQVHVNPTTRDVRECAAAARDEAIDLILAVGGGSSIDTAKGCNFILTNGGEMRDYWGVGKASKPMLPLIAIPTTAGTGSECQSFALIADETTHQKMACGDPKAAARIALLDPQLTLTQPRHVTAATGIDALAHAIESAVCKRASTLSRMYSRQALALIAPHLSRVLQHEDDLEARGAMLLGAALAGTAIENSMLGAAHSAANPLTAHFDVTHGWAVGIMLPHVIAFNAQDSATAREYAQLACTAGLASPNDDPSAAVAALIAQVHKLLAAAEIPASLAACDVDAQGIPTMADEAAQQWTANFNPRSVTAADFARLYQEAYSAS